MTRCGSLLLVCSATDRPEELQDQGLKVGEQVCQDCEDAKMPDWLRDAWHLVEEAVLLEEHIALLKLGVKLEAMYRTPSENLDRSPSRVAHITLTALLDWSQL